MDAEGGSVFWLSHGADVVPTNQLDVRIVPEKASHSHVNFAKRLYAVSRNLSAQKRRPLGDGSGRTLRTGAAHQD